MKIEEQVLSIEQMKHLQELGVDTSDASMCWLRYNIGGVVKQYVEIYDVKWHDWSRATPYPTYTIGDLIEKLPKNIDGSCLLIEFCASDLGYGDWDCGELYGINAQQKFNDKSLKEALYDLLCWVAETHKELLEVKK